MLSNQCTLLAIILLVAMVALSYFSALLHPSALMQPGLLLGAGRQERSCGFEGCSPEMRGCNPTFIFLGVSTIKFSGHSVDTRRIVWRFGQDWHKGWVALAFSGQCRVCRVGEKVRGGILGQAEGEIWADRSWRHGLDSSYAGSKFSFGASMEGPEAALVSSDCVQSPCSVASRICTLVR